MSWTQTVLQLTERPGPDRPETAALARRNLRQLDADVWLALRSAKQEAAVDGVRLSLVQLPDLHDYLTEDEPPIPGAYEVRVAKNELLGHLRFLDKDAARASASGNPGDFETAVFLKLADIQETVVGTVGISILPWDVSGIEKPLHPFGKPARTVRDYAKTPIVPSNVSTWMVEDEFAPSSLHPFFGPLAAQRLAMCLPSSVEGDPMSVVARLEGKIKCRSLVEPAEDPVWQNPSLYRILNDACMWLYAEAKETSNKHALLTGEIARAWTDGSWGAGLTNTLEDALVSAQVAYRLHLQEKGVDALKLMADLRKGVAEDVRGVSNQMSALSAALWRDAAVALGTVALKNTGAVGDWVTFLVAIYLAVGGYLSLRWADQTVAAIGENELAFRKSLYRPLLTDSTYKVLALTRYADVFREFRTFWRIIGGIYLVAIAVVLATVGVPLYFEDAGGAMTFVMNLQKWLFDFAHKVITTNP